MAEQPKPKPKTAGAIPDLFKDSFFISEKLGARRAFAFPVALIIHAIIVGALIVIPLLSTSELPRVEVYSAFLAPPRLRLPRPRLLRKKPPLRPSSV